MAGRESDSSPASAGMVCLRKGEIGISMKTLEIPNRTQKGAENASKRIAQAYNALAWHSSLHGGASTAKANSRPLARGKNSVRWSAETRGIRPAKVGHASIAAIRRGRLTTFPQERIETESMNSAFRPNIRTSRCGPAANVTALLEGAQSGRSRRGADSLVSGWVGDMPDIFERRNGRMNRSAPLAIHFSAGLSTTRYWPK